MIKDIIEKYTIDKLSINEICKIFKIGKLKVKNILHENNIPINKIGAVSLQRKEKPLTIDIKNKILICNNCGNEYDDIENKSGIITKHLKECLPNLNHPSETQKRNLKKYEGKYWHFDYFTLKEKENKEIIKCAECDWVTTDITNISGSYTKHIEKEHGNLENFLLKNKTEKKYFNKYNKKEERLELLKQDFVSCKICGEKMFSVNEKHLQTKHNISLSEYKLKYLGLKTVSNITSEKLKLSYDSNLKYYENNFKSKAEKEISDLIKSYGVNVLNNNKKILDGVEIDIFLPELNIAIEYNGLYYHTEEMGKDKWFHLNKQNICKNKNINLIHIFEDEWVNKKEIVIDKLIHLIGKNNKPKIYGRQLTVKLINKEISFEFLNKHHIQGSPPQAKINIGGFYNNELVSVMSFIENKNEWNLVRFATHNKYRLIGVASKLLSKLEHKNKNIISFADRRWTLDSTNNLYTTLGFQLVNTLSPDYKYVNFKLFKNNRFHKFNFRKKIIFKKYPYLDFSKTEKELTTELGFQRIWDCGLFKYELKIKGK